MRPAAGCLSSRPAKDTTPHLEENLRALLTQDYPDYEVTFIVEDAGDAACPVIRRAMAACPQTPARLLVAGRAEGCGQKVHNLRTATADLPPEIRHLAFFDSDSRPKPYFGPRGDLQALPAENRRDHGLPLAHPPKADRREPPGLRDQLQRDGRAGPRLAPHGLGRFLGHPSRDVRATEDPRGLGRDAQRRPGGLEPVAPQRLEVRFDPACVLTSPVDFDWAGMLDFVRRQYRITRHYAFRWWLLALAAATVANLAWLVSLGLLAWAMLCASRRSAWLPATALGALYGLGLYRGWAMQGLAAVYSPENLPELRGVRRWHVWASPAVAFVQWLGLIASAFGNRVTWRAIDYRLGADGRVLSQRILARLKNDRIAIALTRTTQSVFCPARPMNILLWDTRQLDVSKDFAGGFGVGMYRGQGGPRDALVRWFYRRDRRPAALLFAHLAAIFARLGHRVQYVVDRPPRGADLYVFNPSLITLDLERQVIARLLAEEPQARVLVVGTAASILPQEFADLA